jgi:GntR family transcriptional repressor for pyruvate dehydrogenase complex
MKLSAPRLQRLADTVVLSIFIRAVHSPGGFGVRQEILRLGPRYHATVSTGEAVPRWSEPSPDADPLSVRSKPVLLADLIESEIRSRRLAAGNHLGTKDEIRRRFKVSHGTVNSALRVLVDRGVIIMRPGVGGGIRVADRTPTVSFGRAVYHLGDDDPEKSRRVGEALSLYFLLQPVVAATAAHNHEAADVDRLVVAGDRLRATVDDPDDYLDAHWEVHTALLEATHDPTLITVIRALLAATTSETGHGELPVGEDRRSYVEERATVHLALLDAVIGRDVKSVWRALAGHGVTPADQATLVSLLPPAFFDIQAQWTQATAPRQPVGPRRSKRAARVEQRGAGDE